MSITNIPCVLDNMNLLANVHNKRCNDPFVNPFIEAFMEMGVSILQHVWLKSIGS